MHVIRELCSFEDRRPGTDAERRAANRLAERLRDTGRRAEVEPIYVHPQWGLIQALHCLLGVVGSLVSIAQPAVGFALVLAGATSMYLDVNARSYLLRRLLFRRASQNVLSRGGRRELPHRLILCAHYDAARTGAIFHPKRLRRLARLDSLLPIPIGGFRPVFWSMALLLPVLGARMAGVDAPWLSAIQVPPTLILVVGIFLLVDIELSDSVPAANDNASGVATVLSVAAALDDEPAENLDVWVLLTGAEECLMEGMRSFLRSHRGELEPGTTWFVNVDSVGRGEVRFTVAEGPVVSYGLDPRLAELCTAIATAGRESEDGVAATPLRWDVASDALPVRLSKRRATTITCLEPGQLLPPNYHVPSDTPENIDPAALSRAHSFILELIRQLDRDVGRSEETMNRSPAAVVDSS
jgi:hypothetical protein